MALHDVDKNGNMRSSPKPNADDNVLNRMAHGTTQSTYRKDTSNTTARMAFFNGMIVMYDTDDNVTSVYGYVPAVSTDVPILVIARPGYDVFTDVLEISRPTGL